MTEQHPITPPPELVQQWHTEAGNQPFHVYIATQAARWGADQELEACCVWLTTAAMTKSWETVAQLALELRTARRPKPPSLKEQALADLALLQADATTHGLGFNASAIRTALESLPD